MGASLESTPSLSSAQETGKIRRSNGGARECSTLSSSSLYCSLVPTGGGPGHRLRWALARVYRFD